MQRGAASRACPALAAWEMPRRTRSLVEDLTMLLLQPYRLGPLELPNRLVMAPLTRNRAPGGVPNDMMVTYYAQRASAGLIVSEGTQVAPLGQGYQDTPGIYTADQRDG